MIYTYPSDHPALPTNDPPIGTPPAMIDVSRSQSFDLSEAVDILNQSQSGDVILVYGPRLGWWRRPEIGKLCDFLGYRGTEIIHVVGKHDTNHNAYLSDRLEKLYDEDILDAWAKV